jgi:hypothetical protein
MTPVQARRPRPVQDRNAVTKSFKASRTGNCVPDEFPPLRGLESLHR